MGAKHWKNLFMKCDCLKKNMDFDREKFETNYPGIITGWLKNL